MEDNKTTETVETVETQEQEENETVETTQEETTENNDNKETNDIETKLKELEKKEQELKQKELEFTLKNELSKAKLPNELTKYLNINSETDISSFIKDFSKVINKIMVDNSYQPSGQKKDTNMITKEQFSKMGYVERLNLYNTNPSLFEALSK